MRYVASNNKQGICLVCDWPADDHTGWLTEEEGAKCPKKPLTTA